MLFKDRDEAGKNLAEKLAPYKGGDVVVYALPRGGVVTAYRISQALKAPLDLIITRKIGHPGDPECALCAVAEDGDIVCDEIERPAVDKEWLAKMVDRERHEAKRRREAYCSGVHIPACGRTAILVDDGVATGLTMSLAVREVLHEGPTNVVVAVPVLPKNIIKLFERSGAEVVCLDAPDLFEGAVGSYYESFPQVEDAQVIKLLSMSRRV